MKKMNKPNLRKIMQEYIISLPGIRFNSKKKKFNLFKKIKNKNKI